MSMTLTITDDLFIRLEKSAQRRGLDSVERLLDVWQTFEEEMLHRKGGNEDGREEFFAYYGERVSLANQDQPE